MALPPTPKFQSQDQAAGWLRQIHKIPCLPAQLNESIHVVTVEPVFQQIMMQV